MMRTSRSRFFLAAEVVALLVFLAYAPALWQGFVNYDDPAVIVHNEVIEGPSVSNIGAVFGEVRDNAWLPFYYASFWIDHAFWGKNPAGYHLLNLFLHALNAVLLMAIARRLTGRLAVGVIAGAVFAVHPVLVESVAWASGRKDVLSMAFMLSAMLVFMRGLDTNRKRDLVGLPAALFLLGVFTKATVVVFPALAWLVARHLAKRGDAARESRPVARLALIVFAVIAVGAAGVHMAIAGAEGTVGGGDGALGPRLLGMLGVFGRYVGNAIIPSGLSVHYHEPFDGAFGPAQVNGLVSLLALGVLAAVSRKKAPVIALGVLWLMVSLAPFNNIAPRFSIAMADRYLYVGMAGVAAIVAGFLAVLPRLRTSPVLMLAVAAVIVGSHTWSTNQRTRVWSDSVTLWTDAVEKSPEAALPHIMLADALKERAENERGPKQVETFKEIKASYRTALDVARTPTEALQARLKLAGVLVQIGEFADALPEFEAIEKTLAESEVELPAEERDGLTVTEASAFTALRRYEEARRELGRIPEASPSSLDARNMSAVVDVMEAREKLQVASTDAEKAEARTLYDRGLATYRTLAEKHPEHKKSRIEYVEALLGAKWTKNQIIEVTSEVTALIRDFPFDAKARFLRASVFLEVDPQKAADDLKIAIKTDGYRVEPYILLAAILRRAGKNKEAVATLRLGLELQPDSELLRAELANSYLAFAYHHFNTKEPDLALEACNEAISIYGDTAEAYVLRGELREQQATSDKVGDRDEVARLWDSANADFVRALEIDAGVPRAAEGRARYHKYRGYAYAWEATRPMKGTDADIVLRKTELRRRQMTEFLRAVELAPGYEALDTVKALLGTYSKTFYDKALQARDDRELEQARDHALTALKWDAKEPENHALLAEIERADGRYEAAIAAYREALQHDANHMRSLYELGKLLYVEKRWKEALDLLERFTKNARASGNAARLETLISVAGDLAGKCREKLAGKDG